MLKHLLLAISLQLTPLVYHPALDRPKIEHVLLHHVSPSGGGGALVFNTATNSALLAAIGGF